MVSRILKMVSGETRLPRETRRRLITCAVTCEIFFFQWFKKTIFSQVFITATFGLVLFV